MEWLKKIKAKEQAMKDKLDITKKFPGYFKKTIFRVAFLCIGLIMLCAWIVNGYSLFAVENYCPASYTQLCTNPFYNGAGLNPMVAQHECDKLNCDSKYLSPGEGYKLPFVVKHANNMMWTILFIAFAINHILYKRGQKNEVSHN